MEALLGWFEGAGVSPHRALIALLAATRFFAFFSVFPLATWLNLGGLLRLTVSLMFAVAFAGQVATENARPEGDVAILALVVKEGLVGALLGAALGAPVWIAQGAGDIVDYLRGASASNTLDSMNAVETSVMGQVNAFIAQSWIASSGALKLDIGAVWDSLKPLPPERFTPLQGVGLEVSLWGLLGEVARGSALAAAPLVILLLLIDAVVFLIGRSAANLHLDTAALAAKALVVLVALPIHATVVFTSVEHPFRQALGSVLAALGIAR